MIGGKSERIGYILGCPLVKTPHFNAGESSLIAGSATKFQHALWYDQ